MKLFPVWWADNGKCACGSTHLDENGKVKGSPAKHPLTKNGFKDATEDEDQIAQWREEWPKANWGIATGEGLLVVDLDIKPGKNGVETIKALGVLPRTRTVRTGSGGLHLYFRVTETFPNTSSKLGSGIDTRCDGGYVLAPGSNHVSGKNYELIVDAPVADAPEWLLERLRALRTKRPQISDSDSSERGFFPPASPEVLEAAREALARHGPAIEGKGGDDHTFRAAALLVHDFALTEDEAWPLIKEWNETCQPPWGENDLRAKLQGGEKYGTAPYGIKRSMEATSIVQKRIADWKGGDGVKLVQDCRPLLKNVTDPTVRAQIERDIEQATGFKPKEMGLPKGVVQVELKQNEILMTTELAKVADQATSAIQKVVFQRNGMLCEVVTGQRTFISDLQVARIRDLMSAHAKFVHVDEKKGQTYQPAPEPIASIIHARRMHEKVRVIDAVTTSPIFLADGSILQTKGYNEQAKVYLDPSVTVDVPERPKKQDAQAAVAVFEDLLCDFKFATKADFSTWLAALLTPLVKASIDNSPAPLFVFSASNAGSGKSLLAEVLARIVTGSPAENSSYQTKDANEWLKKVTSFVKAGSPIRIFDNVNGQFGDESLDRLITSSVWSDRVLGASDAPPLPVVTTWITNGNNSEPVGDTVRRCLASRIEVDVERPQERTDFKRPMLAEYTQANRAPLLTAALTILRAYHVENRPSQRLPSWGSFMRWSELVRGAIVWTGLPDPFETQRRLAADVNEPENAAHDFWIAVVEQSDGTPTAVAQLANQRDARIELGLRNDVTPFLLRKFLTHFLDRPRNGKRIRRTAGNYHVEVIP